MQLISKVKSLILFVMPTINNVVVHLLEIFTLENN